MSNETELMRIIEQLTSDNAKMAGRFAGIAGYLDAINIPKVPKINKRVKLMTIMYQQLQIENKRLTLLLTDMDEDDA